MSDYHILSADEYGNKFNIIMHVPVPDTTNLVGTNFRVAVVEMQGGAPIGSSLIGITAPEQGQLDAGELYEVRVQFNSNPGESLSDKRDKLDLLYAATVAETQENFGDQLDFWGYDRDVP